MTHYDYGFRIYNPSIGKFLSVDPLTKSYPELTPYQFASNSPIANIDLDGLESWYYVNSSGVFLRSPVIAGPYDPNIMNKNGYFTEAQARQRTEQSARNYINRENQQQSIQQSYAYNLVQKRKNPVYGAVEAIHELGPTGSISGAITNFSDGNIGKGLMFSTFALLDLGYLKKISSLAKSERGIAGLADNVTGVNSPALREINVKNGGINCIGCAIAVDATLKGRAASALGDFFSNKNAGNIDLSAMFGRPKPYSKFYEIIENVQKGGDGTTGIVTSHMKMGTGDGHAFNIVNDGGNVRIFDGQAGSEIPMSQLSGWIQHDLKATRFEFYNTTNK